MKPLGRDSAELTALADHLTAHGIALEMLAGPLTGIYDPTGTGRVLFAFFAAMAETERENIREATLEGLNAAARKGRHGGRPPVITDDMLHTVLRRRASGESVESIRPDLIIPAGRQTQRTHPEPGQHLPGDRREREAAVVPRGRRPSPGRLRLSPDQRLIDRPLESPLLNEPPGPYPPDLRRVLLRPRRCRASAKKYQTSKTMTSAELRHAMPETVSVALAVGTGLQVMAAMMHADVETVCGPRGKHNPSRAGVRHGTERGSVTLGGRRVPVERPRMRAADDSGELPVPSYELFSQTEVLGRMAMARMLGGLSTRRYRGLLGNGAKTAGNASTNGG